MLHSNNLRQRFFLDQLLLSYVRISGVFNETYMQGILKSEFLSKLENNSDLLKEWREKHAGKTPSESLRESVLEYVGRPIHGLLE